MIQRKLHVATSVAILSAMAAACSAGNGVDESATTSESIGVGVYNFGAMANPGSCLDVAGGGTADGTNVQEWLCNGTGAQSIRIEDIGGGLARLVNTSSGKCIDVAGNGDADGTNVHLWTCNGTGAQAFRIEDVGGSNVRIVDAKNGKCIDVAGAGRADGTNVQLWSCNGSAAQLWHLAAIGGGNAPAPTPSPTPAPPAPPAPAPPPAPGGGGGAWTDLPPRGDGVWVRVKNACAFPLWIHGEGNSAVLQPDDASLAPGASRDYVAPKEWTAARVTAFTDGPRQGEVEKAEMTLTGGVLNYNVTYVDWVGLPLAIQGVGGNCNAAQHTTGCYAKESAINAGCPEGFLREGKKCLSARTYCLNPVHQGEAYCHALDGAIASCAGCKKASTPEVYACSGAYAEEPRMCAALNRGLTSDPDNANASLYYKNGPYNTYSKWVHEVCPDIYAFSYDDWQSHGGFRACSGSELRITFCPGG